ncbi:hypothetical protein BS50DRAFT_377225 [Corynespora cassiicola Philippines]|uniref:Zn(2)-C6 fungal-type domain-containing protein n=1 Tax=Corynespora cassiicola Philippines TaxID=1448308 RepID=A0A2T2NN84_CORCC|nr:hypothetical protein BS50DRAFT_377225 [Corynespora cassiicola Philippines]
MPKLACKDCRERKLKCIVLNRANDCERCAQRGLRCSLNTTRQESRAFSVPGGGDIRAAQSAHTQTPAHHFGYNRDMGSSGTRTFAPLGQNSALDVGYGTSAELLREGELTQTLLVLYFDNFSDIHFLFEQTMMLRHYALGLVPRVVLLSMMALGVRYSHAPFREPEMRAHWGEPLINEARQLLQSEFDELSLPIIQAYILQATYHLTFGGARRGRMYLDSARSLLSLLKLHKSLETDENDPLQAEMARRLVATLAVMDHIFLPFSGYERSSICIHPLPRLLNQEEFNALRSRSHFSPRSHSAPNIKQELLDLSAIYHDVCAAYKVNNVESTGARLRAWLTALPPESRYTDASFSIHSEDFTLRPFIFLHVLYHHAWQVILIDHLEWTTRVLGGGSPQLSSEVLELYAHADSIAALTQRLWNDAHFDLHNSCFGLAVIMTQCTLLHRLLSSSDPTERASARHKMRCFRDCIIRVKLHCRLFNWVFHQSEWLLRVCGQDRFWEDEMWPNFMHDQLMTLGTRFERLDLQTAGRRSYLESMADAQSYSDHLENSIPRILRDDVL